MLALALQDESNRDELAVARLTLVEHEYEPAANDSRYPHARKLAVAPSPIEHVPALLLYEEYHPYGTSAYRAVDSSVDVSARRYRYSGMERDDETGLGYHTARYYVSWLGRWTASDPIGLAGGGNRFEYCGGNPVGRVDLNGEIWPTKEFFAPSEDGDSSLGGALVESAAFFGKSVAKVAQNMGETLAETYRQRKALKQDTLDNPEQWEAAQDLIVEDAKELFGSKERRRELARGIVEGAVETVEEGVAAAPEYSDAFMEGDVEKGAESLTKMGLAGITVFGGVSIAATIPKIFEKGLVAARGVLARAAARKAARREAAAGVGAEEAAAAEAAAGGEAAVGGEAAAATGDAAGATEAATAKSVAVVERAPARLSAQERVVQAEAEIADLERQLVGLADRAPGLAVLQESAELQQRLGAAAQVRRQASAEAAAESEELLRGLGVSVPERKPWWKRIFDE